MYIFKLFNSIIWSNSVTKTAKLKTFLHKKRLCFKFLCNQSTISLHLISRLLFYCFFVSLSSCSILFKFCVKCIENIQGPFLVGSKFVSMALYAFCKIKCKQLTTESIVTNFLLLFNMFYALKIKLRYGYTQPNYCKM